ncbi:MAG: hypothetical protein MZV64_11075 [Ignavibacteriales bacterium]|nr:hypothetical protein [Ignavibacteriales bacterium]
MKKEAALGLSLALVLFSASALAGAPRPAPQQSSDKLLATYYFYWYDIYTNLHFFDPDGLGRPDPPSSGRGLGHVQLHRGLLAQWTSSWTLMAAGVDVVLPIYWGDDTNLYWSQSGLRNLVTAEQALIGQGRTPPRIGMSYDTTALEYQNGHVPPDLTTPAGKSLFYGMIADFFLPSRALSGRPSRAAPIIVLYVSHYVSAYDQSTFDYAIQRFQADFGATPFIVRESSWQNVATAGVYTWGVALNGPGTWGEVGSLGPGYDESAVYGRPDPRIRVRVRGVLQGRLGGHLKRRSVLRAPRDMERISRGHRRRGQPRVRHGLYSRSPPRTRPAGKPSTVRRRPWSGSISASTRSREVCGRPLIPAMAFGQRPPWVGTGRLIPSTRVCLPRITSTWTSPIRSYTRPRARSG